MRGIPTALQFALQPALQEEGFALLLQIAVRCLALPRPAVLKRADRLPQELLAVGIGHDCKFQFSRVFGFVREK